MKKKCFVQNRKGDMSIQMIIAIVIGLAILLIAMYMIMDKGRTAGKAGGCDETDLCVKTAKDCKDGMELSFQPCKKGKESGRCCIEV